MSTERTEGNRVIGRTKERSLSPRQTSSKANGDKSSKAQLAPVTGPPPLDRKQLLVALTALKKGDFSARLPIEWEGLNGKIADTFNDVIELNEKMAKELERL